MSQRLDRLWAPWRLEYIKSNSKNKKKGETATCPFCKAAKERPSKSNLVLFKNKKIFVVMNKFPYNPYHLMVIPCQHVGDLGKIDKSTWLEMNQAVQVTVKILKKILKPHGFNIGMNLGEAAGAGIAPHLHTHILPRWNGDTNFMPLLAEAKALPAHNLTVYKNLYKHFPDFSASLSKIKLD